MNPQMRVSPDGRYEITCYEREVFNTHWIETPALRDKQTGDTLFEFEDTHWSMDEVSWPSESVVRFVLRKYPGNHQPGDLVTTINCAERVGRVGDGAAIPLAEIEAALDQSLTWIYAKEPAPPASLLSRLQRFLRGG